MNDPKIELLEKNGWEVECESPFEIRHKDDPESFATGWAAELIYEYYVLYGITKNLIV